MVIKHQELFFEDVNDDFGYGNEAIIAVTTSYSDEGQNIMMSYSIDGGYNFLPVKEEPILWNPHKETNENFRDPYFFKKDNKFIMYIAEENEFGVYVSNNPISGYEKTGSFKAQHPMLECPNIFQMNVEYEEKVEKKWVALYGGNGGWGENKDDLSSGTYYVVGDLDEKTYVFKPDSDKSYKRLDFGPDYYAAKFMTKSPYNTNIDSLITTGWVSNWSYNYSIPNDGRLGNMSLAREIKLTKETNSTGFEYIMKSDYIGFNNFKPESEGKYLSDSNLIKSNNLIGKYYKADFSWNNIGNNEVNLIIGDNQYSIKVNLDYTNNKIKVKRDIKVDFNYGKEEFTKERIYNSNLKALKKSSNLEIYIDKTIVEFKFTDNSTFTMLKFVDSKSFEDIKLSTKASNLRYSYYQIKK
ncbi:glycoside hydrolase family protein [Spiroplasma litorale]|uniref:glycoside hydrolase family 32 protein n=1 Tax=Spiroplasma litorale TaxID=216942 RepID=UPI0009468841|nr:glycoside hydrolase family 32 protein [Spiroplasma litorale]